MAAVAVSTEEGSGSHVRRDELVAIQDEAQARWAEERIFEVDAPLDDGVEEGKYTANFPYPYMNGVLHLGHGFSLSKVEFATAFHRLCGKRSLFPQGFHCTGTPIKACADKLNLEIETYGNPPNFPKEEPLNASENPTSQQQEIDPTKFQGKKSKAAAKQGTSATQWGILKQSGIPESEIPNFRDPKHWLYYFPPLCQRDMTSLGCGIDWRRSFVTTDANPFYDSFVRWQFNILKDQGRITKAKRYSVYSPKDGQPCADHDRASGEGATAQEYTLVKMEALELPGKLVELKGNGPVYLMAATLRPETMAGQTNCWVLPEGDYGAFRGLNQEIFVMTARAARNLAFQDKTPVPGQAELLLTLKGQDLIGVPLKAPNSPYDKIYVLPLLTILTKKGTGVVTSVPSDSPDDYAAFTDLKKKPKLREKFGVKDEWIMPFEVTPVINIPGFGDHAAEKVCRDLKIQSQNDTKKLEEAKKLVYLRGFTDGIMVTGKYAGEKVCDSKDKHKADLLSAGQAIIYSEPSKEVISRSGDECVVALTDQWYLDYGEPKWLEAVKKELAQMNMYSDETRNQFNHVLEWLHEWACSRSFGLGTRLPWDPVYLIESLSDSTIYMAYYTVAHLLHQGDIFGQQGCSVKPEDMTDEVWSYIFLGKELQGSSNIPEELLKKMRREFDYWYPFDMRTSGKDLIQNHLTFCLYNHVAIWQEQPEKWPKSIRCNGHLLLNSEKMSKSTGNFLTLQQGVQLYGADAMRLALADAGDAIDDANFVSTTANSAILRLTKELAWINEVVEAQPGLRKGQKLFADRVFANEIRYAAHKTKEAFETMLIRDALKHGCYELQKARDAWRVAVGPDGMDADLVQHYIEVSTLLLTPICPHTCDHIWRNILKKPGSALKAGWPELPQPDAGLQRQAGYIEKLRDRLVNIISKETQVKKQKKGESAGSPVKVSAVELYVAKHYSGWQATVLQYLQSKYDPKEQKLSADAIGPGLIEAVKAEGTSDIPVKSLQGLCIPFARKKAEEATLSGVEYLSLDLPFDEVTLVEENHEYLTRTLNLRGISAKRFSGELPNACRNNAKAEPGGPAVVLVKADQ